MKDTKTNIFEGCESFLDNINIKDYKKAQLSDDVYIYYFTHSIHSVIDPIKFDYSIYVDTHSNICKLTLTEESWSEDPLVNLLDREKFNNPGLADDFFGKTTLAVMEECPTSRRNQLYYIFSCSCLNYVLISAQLYNAFEDISKRAFFYHCVNSERKRSGLDQDSDDVELSDDISCTDVFSGISKKIIN